MSGVSGERLGVLTEMLEHGTHPRQCGDGIDGSRLDAFDHLLQRSGVDERVGGVEFLRVDADGVPLEQENVLHLGDFGLDIEPFLFRTLCELRGVLVSDDVGDDLEDEVLLPDLVKVREEGDEALQTHGAVGGIACADCTGGVGGIMVEGFECFLRNALLLDPCVELADERVGLRAVDNSTNHFADDPVPRCVEKIDAGRVASRHLLHLCLGVQAVLIDLGALGVSARREHAAGLRHPVLDLRKHRHGRLRKVRDGFLDDVNPRGYDAKRPEVGELQLVEGFLTLRLNHDRSGEHRGIGHHAHHAVVKLDERV